MNPRVKLACLAGDAAHWGLVHILHRNGGNAPGVIASRLAPNLMDALARELSGSVVFTGTNGKTTTTGLVADSLAASGMDVTCNRAGNNMETGIAAALVLGRHGSGGGARHMGCFECDELYTVRVLPKVRPGHLVLLNLFRDQLDRYGEIDRTQEVIAEALRRSPSTAFIYNADDPLSASVAGRVDNVGVPFGIDEPTGSEDGRISDSRFCTQCNAPMDYEYVQYGQLGKYRCPSCGWRRPELAFAATNVRLGEDGYEFDVEDRRGADAVTHHLSCRYSGLYMVYNITAAFAACVCAGGDPAKFQRVLDAYQPAAGRMQTFALDGREAVVNLAKNPAGFNQMINQIRGANGRLMAFFLNDADGDGHDISWIWDVDFESLNELRPRMICVGGTRKEELAVRLKYGNVRAEIAVVSDMGEALSRFDGALAYEPELATMHVVANYTACPPVVADLEKLQKTWRWSGATRGVVTSAAAVSPCDDSDRGGVALERPLRIVHLYPDALNLYGDGGNIASLRRRCEWRGIPVRVDRVLMGEHLDLSDADIVLLGGGADRDQLAVAHELRGQRDQLVAYVADGGVLLAICGGYQLLGKFYEMGRERVEGLGILDIETTSGETRLIGNGAVKSSLCDQPIVGFENHAGRTVLGGGEEPLGRCLAGGGGNNGSDGGEGVLHGNVVGTYLHGPVLPKNPGMSDWLIGRALERRGADARLAPLDDACEQAAHAVALRLAR